MINKLFPNEEIIDGKYFNVHQDWEIPIPGFFIVASKRKIRSISEFTDKESLEFINFVRKLRKGMDEILNIKDVYIFQNEDSVYNFHLWIFPRHDWMEKFGNKIESVIPIINYAKENMVNDETIKSVKEYVKKMKNYMSNKS